MRSLVVSNTIGIRNSRLSATNLYDREVDALFRCIGEVTQNEPQNGSKGGDVKGWITYDLI